MRWLERIVGWLRTSLKKDRKSGQPGTEPEEAVARPTFAPISGDYPDEVENITITCATAGATIRRTDDGSEPTSGSTEYTVPFTDSTIGVRVHKAKGFKAGLLDSATGGATYNIFDSTPPAGDSWDVRAMRALPTDGTFSEWAGPAGSYRIVGASDGSDNPTYATVPLALAASSPGDTILIRGGHLFWAGNSFLNWSGKDGTAGNPITIGSYPGELAWIHIDHEEFYDDPATAWEPVVGGIDEYRSTSTFSGLVGLNRSARFFDSMVSIQSSSKTNMDQVSEIRPVASENNFYFGPMIRFDTTELRYHIRLTHTNLAWLETSDYADLGGGDYNYKGETDPRNLQILVGRSDGATSARIVVGNHQIIRDLVVTGGDKNILVSGKTGVVLDNIWSYASASSAVFVTNSETVTVQNSHLVGVAAPWTSRISMKYNGGDNLALQFSVCRNVVVDRCDLLDAHDVLRIDRATVGTGTVQISRNNIWNSNDDLFVNFPKQADVTCRVFQNHCKGAVSFYVTFGPGGAGVTSTADSGDYIYRNLFDMRWGCMGGPPHSDMPEGLDAPNLFYSGIRGFGSLTMSHSDNYRRPYTRFYHNIVLLNTRAVNNYFSGFGIHYEDTITRIFNNILVHEDGPPSNVIAVLAGDITQGTNCQWSLDGATLTPLGTDLYADPKFLSLTTDRFNASEDLRLASNSPCVNAGTVLDAAWHDVAAIKAADSGLPDIGAYPQGWSSGTIFGPEAVV